MTENERVKELRKARSLTLEQFGARLGVGKSAISKIERAETNVTDQMRRSICREFCVREEWLRDGAGEMENADLRSVSIQEAVNRLLSGESAEFKRRLIVALSALDESQWVFLRQKMEEIVSISDAEPEDDAEELARQIRDEKKAEADSSASNTAAG